MGSSKPQEHGMKGFLDFFLRKGLEIGKADPTLFTRKLNMIYLHAKYMSITLYLIILIKNGVKSLVGP